MSYTVWSAGRLVGESDLGFARWSSTHRAGHFFPTEFGESIAAICAEPTIAVFALGKFYPRSHLEESEAEARRRKTDPAWIAAEGNYMSALEHRAALVLELRGPTGRVIPTEDVNIRDVELILSLDGRWEPALDEPLSPEQQAEIDEDVAALRESGLFDPEPWRAQEEEKEFPRYQLQVSLLSEWDIP